MYVIELTYRAALEQIEPVIADHRQWLDEMYAAGHFIASGPQVPRKGGIIIASARLTHDGLEAVLAGDPFYRRGLADYRVVTFEATKHIPALAPLA